MVEIRSKIIQLSAGAVLTARGAGGDWPERIGRQLGAYLSFDAMMCDLADRVEALYADCVAEQGSEAPADGYQLEAYLAGWSRSAGRPACVWLSSAPVPMGGGAVAPAFTLREAPTLALFPAPTGTFPSILGRDIDAASIDDMDAEVDGLAMIEAQRRTPQRGGFHVAAGWAELTSITRDGVQRSVLRRWPDEIGRPVAP